MGRTLLSGITLGLLLFGTVFAQQQGTVKSGAGRTFKISDLTGDRLGRIVASTEFQVSLTLPVEIQNVGVNATKQNVLIPTVDESDGRVIYLDVLKAGGYATLNIRLVNKGEPLVLKLTVELSDKTSGVLSYTIRDAPAATGATKPAAPPAPAPAPPSAPRVQTFSPPVVSKPKEAPVAPLPPANRSPVTHSATAPTPRPSSSPTSGGGQDSPLRIELTKDQAGSTTTTDLYTYMVRPNGNAEGIKFILMPKAMIRAGGGFVSDGVKLQPNQPMPVTATGILGKVAIDKRNLSGKLNVLMFTFSPVDTKTQKVLTNRYVGVMVKP